MPPSLPRSSSLLGLHPISAKPALPLRCCAFSTSTPNRVQHIPPESPRFIKLPKTPQSEEVRLPRVKGTLPVPREIFQKKTGTRQVDPSYVAQTSPVSAAEQAGLDPRSEKQAWKRKAAAARRSSLAEGLQGLWKRKQARESAARARARANLARNRAAAEAPEGLDDVLTRSTVRASTAESVAVAPDPKRLELAAESAARTAAIAQAKADARRDALQELYIAAGSFIVTESELERKVEELFSEDHFGRGFSSSQNVWGEKGAPQTVQSMFHSMTGTGHRGIEASYSDLFRTTMRQKAVAEELTGGKMKDD